MRMIEKIWVKRVIKEKGDNPAGGMKESWIYIYTHAHHTASPNNLQVLCCFCFIEQIDNNNKKEWVLKMRYSHFLFFVFWHLLGIRDEINAAKNCYYWSFVSRKVNKKPLTIRLAIGLGILRHNCPSRYATTPDNTNLPIPTFQTIFPFCFLPVDTGTMAFPSFVSNFSFHLTLAISLPACFRNPRIIKLTNRCSHKVRTVGPIFQSCKLKLPC